MSDGKSPFGKPLWFADMGEPRPAFSYRPSAGLVHDASTSRFVRFVLAAHAIGADADAVAAFLNDLKPPQMPSESEDF